MSIHSAEYLHGNIRVGGVKGIEDGKGWRCDNTHQWALSQSSEKTGSFKTRRTKNFHEHLSGAREALGILERNTDEFTAIMIPVGSGKGK